MKIWSWVWVMLLVFSCKQAEKENESQPGSEAERLQVQLDSVFNAVIVPDEPGAALLVVYDGVELVSKGYGLRNLDTGEPVTPTTNMRMGSVSKQFTALSILALVDQGKLSLNDEVYKFYPFESFKDVTIRQMLLHTSGLPDAEWTFYKKGDPGRYVTNEDIANYYAGNPEPVFPPGEGWDYNSGTYAMMASLVEKITGQQFEKYSYENVLKKAGMENSSFFSDARPIPLKERAFCYDRDSLGNWEKVDGHYLGGILGSGALYTSIHDFYNYIKGLRNQTIVSKTSHEAMLTPSEIPATDSGDAEPFMKGISTYYALGLEIGDDFIKHSGRSWGTNTMFYQHTEYPLDFAIFMNSDRLFHSGLIEATCDLTTRFAEKMEKQERKL